MALSLSDIAEKDRGLLSPCGIICGGCDVFTNESVEAAKAVIQIWEGFNLSDVAILSGLTSEEVLTTIGNLKKFVGYRDQSVTCPGCYISGGPFKKCPIWECVKSKGYWTCAECEDFSGDSIRPCPHSKTERPDVPFSSREEKSNLVCERYNSNNIENLKKCREIGYPAFVEQTKEKLEKGWRTWQVISREMVVTKMLKRRSI